MDPKLIEALERDSAGFTQLDAQAIDVRARAIIAGGGFPAMGAGGDVSERVYSRRSLRRWVGYALVACAVLSIGLLSTHQPSPRNSSIEYKTYATDRGKRAKIDLSDGSTISLSVGSQIRYAKDFGKSGREVYLTGEAYFEVPRNALAPFVVHTGNTVTRVLGTSFGVRQYKDELFVRVIVNAGKVQVKASKEERVVTAGEAVKASTAAVEAIPMDASATAWMRGEMVFINTPLRDVVKEMQRWYGIDIRLNDPTLSKELVTATLRSQNPQEAVRIIAVIFGARTVRNGNTVTIYRR